MIANEASTGLYFSQLHNHSVCKKKTEKGKKETEKIEKYTIAK
jgi:hypothetical protein